MEFGETDSSALKHPRNDKCVGGGINGAKDKPNCSEWCSRSMQQVSVLVLVTENPST